jgi:hypothetical protein
MSTEIWAPVAIDMTRQADSHAPWPPAAAVGSPAWQLLEPLVQQYGQGILSQSMLHNPEFHHFYVAGKGSVVFCRVQDYGR